MTLRSICAAAVLALSLSAFGQTPTGLFQVQSAQAKLTLRPDSSFRWDTKASVSTGKFVREKGEVHLEFLRVDGQPVVPGAQTLRLSLDLAKRTAKAVRNDPVLPEPAAESHPLAGKWTLEGEASEDLRSVVLAISPDGTFVFRGPGFRSEGKVTLADGHVVFDYERIDGKKVADGTVRLRVPFGGPGPLGTPPGEGSPKLQAGSEQGIRIEGRTYRRNG